MQSMQKIKDKMNLLILFNEIRDYGDFTADFECVDSIRKFKR